MEVKCIDNAINIVYQIRNGKRFVKKCLRPAKKADGAKK